MRAYWFGNGAEDLVYGRDYDIGIHVDGTCEHKFQRWDAHVCVKQVGLETKSDIVATTSIYTILEDWQLFHSPTRTSTSSCVALLQGEQK